ncbi:hypothetical protein MHYP_G00261980 [Metynnis hypsauchen]
MKSEEEEQQGLHVVSCLSLQTIMREINSSIWTKRSVHVFSLLEVFLLSALETQQERRVEFTHRRRLSNQSAGLCSSSNSHSLQYLYTTITPRQHFPEFTVVGLLDGEPFVYYDSNITKKIPKTEWMEKNEGEDYWNEETQTSQEHWDKFRRDVVNLMQLFNQTEVGGSDDTITGDHRFTVGISVGLGLVFLLVSIGFAVLMCKRRRRRRPASNGEELSTNV